MIEVANKIIENFDIDEDNYSTILDLENKFTLKGSIENNFIYSKQDSTSGKIHINFHNCKNSKIFIGSNFRGSVNVFIKGDNSIIYIGDNVFFTNIQIRSFQNNDKVFLGNKVSSTGSTLFISGGECAESKDTGIIVGDDCLFSYGITIRNGDAHPIYNIDSMKLLNAPIKPIVLDPHTTYSVNLAKKYTNKYLT